MALWCVDCGVDTEVEPDLSELADQLSHRWKKKRDAANRAILEIVGNWRCSDCLTRHEEELYGPSEE